MRRDEGDDRARPQADARDRGGEGRAGGPPGRGVGLVASQAPADLAGSEIRVVPTQVGIAQFATGSAYELWAGDGRLGELALSSGREGATALNQAEATTTDGSWHLYRPVSKLRPRIDVTDASRGVQVATYGSKVFGAGVVALEGSGRFVRPGNPHRNQYRIETEAGEPVLELDGRPLPRGEGTVRVAHSGISRRDTVLLTVITCFARLLYERLPGR